MTTPPLSIPSAELSAPTDLPSNIRALAKARADIVATQAVVDAARAEFAAANADLFARLDAEQQALANLDTMVRALALKEYERLGVKKLTAGVDIALTKSYAVDEVAGLAWAKEKQMCLVPESLDVKAVKKLATVQPLPFVTVTETPSVRIASDLSTLL